MEQTALSASLRKPAGRRALAPSKQLFLLVEPPRQLRAAAVHRRAQVRFVLPRAMDTTDLLRAQRRGRSSFEVGPPPARRGHARGARMPQPGKQAARAQARQSQEQQGQWFCRQMYERRARGGARGFSPLPPDIIELVTSAAAAAAGARAQPAVPPYGRPGARVMQQLGLMRHGR